MGRGGLGGRGLGLRGIAEALGEAVEAVLLVRDGVPADWYAQGGIDVDALSACVLAIVEALRSALDLFGGSLRRLDVKLEDGSHLIAEPVENGGVVVVKTGKNPPLGLVYFLLEAGDGDRE